MPGSGTDSTRPQAPVATTSTTAPTDRTRSRTARGLAGGVGAFVVWGLFPLYWPLVARAGALEILAHRVIWSLAFGLLACLLLRRRFWARVRSAREWATLVGAGAVVTVNWGVYIWAVNHGHVLDAALGYYINPILTILLGVIVLRERLHRIQWIAVGIAGVAVVVLTVEYGRLPWVALALAVSFGTYGLLKKGLHIDAVSGMVVEGLGTSVVALCYLGWLTATGASTFAAYGPGHAILLVLGGLVTLVPLLLFADAAPRLPLSVMGLLQYIAPTGQFLIGWLVQGEQMSPERWAGFLLVWLALTIVTAHALTLWRRGAGRHRDQRART